MEQKKYIAGTHLEQNKYIELKNFGKLLTENDAKAVINREFGFEFSRIEIVEQLATYFVDNNHCLQKQDVYTRKPVYGSSDYNYIRFNCAGWYWEMINGELYAYEC